MKRWQNILTQILGTAIQVLNIWGQIIPEEAKIYVGLGVATVQAVVGIQAHNVNPDGSKAELPYVK